ncbi:MAG: hypothetical protein WDW36_007809 [Sanguina aurantia]
MSGPGAPSRLQQYVALDSEQPHLAESSGSKSEAVHQQASLSADRGTDVKACMKAAFWCWPLWFMAQLAFNMSLARTSVTSNTILSSSSSLFTFALSVLFCGERFSLGKLACIFVCIAGTALVTISDNLSEASEAGAAPPPDGGGGGSGSGSGGSSASQAVIGDLLCVGSAAVYSGYTVLMRRLLGEESGASPGWQDMTVYHRLPEVASAVDAGRSCSMCGASPSVSRGQGRSGAGADPGSASTCHACSRLHTPAMQDASSQHSLVPAAAAGAHPAPVHSSARSLVTGRQSVSAAAGRDSGSGTGDTVGQAGVGEDTESVALFFGFIGLFTSVALAPVLMVMSGLGFMSLTDIPSTAYGVIALEGILDYVLADLLWARSVMLLGPTVATLGLSIQIPLAAVAEFFRDHPAWVKQGSTIAMTLLGTCLVFASFVGVQLSDSRYATAAEFRDGNDALHSHKDGGGGGGGIESTEGSGKAAGSGGMHGGVGDSSTSKVSSGRFGGLT